MTKQPEEEGAHPILRFTLYYLGKTGQQFKLGTWRQEMKQRLQNGAAPCDLLSLLSYRPSTGV